MEGTEVAEGCGEPAVRADVEGTVNPSGNLDAGTRRMRGHASGAVLAWITLLLLGAAIGGRHGPDGPTAAHRAATTAGSVLR